MKKILELFEVALRKREKNSIKAECYSFEISRSWKDVYELDLKFIVEGPGANKFLQELTRELYEAKQK